MQKCKNPARPRRDLATKPNKKTPKIQIIPQFPPQKTRKKIGKKSELIPDPGIRSHFGFFWFILIFLDFFWDFSGAPSVTPAGSGAGQGGAAALKFGFLSPREGEIWGKPRGRGAGFKKGI